MTHLEELVAMRGAIALKMTGLKSELSDIDRTITALVQPVMTDKLDTAGKTYGSFKLSVDGVPIQGSITRTVKWDSDKLKAIADKLPADDAAAFFVVTLSMTEERFADLEELEHPALGELMLARSVSLSAFSAKPIEAKA